MQLLNIGFAILVIKIAFCVLPGVLGIYFLGSSEETKRQMRRTACNALFGVSNAIPFPKFARFLYISGALLLLFSVCASWFLVLRNYI